MDTTLKSYIRKINPDLLKLLNDIDEDDELFTSKALEGGFTFLMPNEEYVAKLCDLYEEDEDRAFEAVMSLIIPQYLRNSGDWKEDISNAHKRKVDVESVGNQIKLAGKNAAVLEIDRSFNPRGQQIAVYNIVSGFVPKGKTQVKSRKAPPKKVNTNSRLEILEAVTEKSNTYSACLEYVASFLKYLKRDRPEFLLTILPFLDYCPITTFILLFEPVKGGMYFIDDSIISDWWATCSFLSNPKETFMSILASNKTLQSAAYESPVSVKEDLQHLRENLRQELSPTTLITSVVDAYNHFVNNNTIEGGDAENVLPTASFQYIQSRCVPKYNLKLVQDEIRADVSIKLEEDHPKTVLTEVCSSLKLYPLLIDFRGMDSSNKKAYLSTVACWVNTTCFMYILPSRPGAFGGKSGYMSESSPVSNKVVDPIPRKMEILSSTKIKHLNVDDLSERFNDLIDSEQQIPDDLVQSAKRLMSKIKT